MIQIGDKKVTKIIAGGNVMVNRENVWLECISGDGFSGTPILMKYDRTTGVTSFIGGIGVMTYPSDMPIQKVLFFLPEGYHFTDTDSSINVRWGAWALSNSSLITLDTNKKEFIAKMTTWPNNTDRSLQLVVAFGFVFTLTSSNNRFEVWQTSTVTPD